MGTDKIKGGKADELTPQDIANKHDVPVEDIKKELKVGEKIEMEHTDDKELSKEITADHLEEFPDYYTNPEAGLKASEKKLEKIHGIKEALREALNMFKTDETPETISYTVKSKGKPVGVVTIDPHVRDMDKYTMELVDLDFLEEFDNLKTGTELMTALWRRFETVNTILLTPKEGTQGFWEKLGAKPLNRSFWIMQRGH